MHHYHDAIDNVSHSDKYFGRGWEILQPKKVIKAEAMKVRWRSNQRMALIEVTNLGYD